MTKKNEPTFNEKLSYVCEACCCYDGSMLLRGNINYHKYLLSLLNGEKNITIGMMNFIIRCLGQEELCTTTTLFLMQDNIVEKLDSDVFDYGHTWYTVQYTLIKNTNLIINILNILLELVTKLNDKIGIQTIL